MGAQVYAEGKWKCPVCGHGHGKPHHSLPNQINYKKKPDQKGRIVFNRRHKDDSLDGETKIRSDVPSAGDSFDVDGYQRPLYCPHCGYEDEFITISRVSGLGKDMLGQFLDERPNARGFLGNLLDAFEDWKERRKG